MSLVGNALVGQSGGPTCVINQSLVGIVEACSQSAAVRSVYGALHGIQGILDEDLIDLGAESRDNLEKVARTPCAALRSVRKKPTREECEQVLKVLQAHDVRFFFYIGGNDSAETAHILNEIAVAEGYEVRLFHVPKTIDNDLRVTDHCPGYGSAARFVAQALMGDNQDNRSLPGIKIDVVMGRHAGWLTAASVLARRFDDDGPHLVYVPERVFNVDAFIGDVERIYGRHGRCLVAVSEGIHDAGGQPILQSQEVDSHGNVQLSGSGALGDLLANTVKARLGSKLRCARGYVRIPAALVLRRIVGGRRRRGARGRSPRRARGHRGRGAPRLGRHAPAGGRRRLPRGLRADRARQRGARDARPGRGLPRRGQRHRSVLSRLRTAPGRRAARAGPPGRRRRREEVAGVR